jgi:cytochrome c oxidase assembly protein subunit 15
MVLGVLGQVVLGGIVVLTGLHPLSNMAHFLLSIVLMTWAFWLVRGIPSASNSVSPPTGSWSVLVSRRGWSLGTETRVAALARYVLTLTGIAIVTGTVVTGSGPHAGDELARRFDLALTVAARFHGLAVITTVVAALCMGLALRRQTRQQRHITVAWEIFLLSAILQGGLGYWQYFTGVPIVLVAIHIAGSVAVWLAALNLVAQAQIKAIVG